MNVNTNDQQAVSGELLLGQPVNRLLILSFIIVALVPLVFVGVKLYRMAWNNAWREISEKHQLLAQNLAAPISIYINDNRDALKLLASSLGQMGVGADSAPRRAALLNEAKAHLTGFRSIALVSRSGKLLYSTAPTTNDGLHRNVYAREKCFLATRSSGQWKLSGIKKSPLTGRPTLILSQPVKDSGGNVRQVLLAELKIELIDQLRRNIHFGKRGHSAIVDQNGHVIAHPNPDWMREMRDLSNWPIVQKMMAGQTGVTEFYSPFVGQNMVAGFAAVPHIGWGIMVPQPRSEVEAHVSALLYPQLGWGALGLILAISLGVALARWITQPLNRLAVAASTVTRNGFHGSLPQAPHHAPREVQQLGTAFGELFDGLRESRARFDALNRSLKIRVDEATRDLREANIQLERLASRDHLTGLANRRYFEDSLAKSISMKRSSDQSLCLMLIDVDFFKAINDHGGHAAGDAVLTQLAFILRDVTRGEDLVARYGGDEFVVKLHCSREVAEQRANEILKSIERHDFRYDGNRVNLTVSVGLFCCTSHDIPSADRLLREIDKALYKAKETGRNRLVEVVG